MVAPFAFLAVASPLHDAAAGSALVAGTSEALRGLGGVAVEAPEDAGESPLAVVFATGGTEERVLRLLDDGPGEARRGPLWLVAGPSNNSLPAALETLARLRQQGRRARLFYLAGPGDEGGLPSIRRALEDQQALRALAGARIGLVGGASSWLVASSPSPEVVRQAWGAEVVPLPMGRLLEAMEGVDEGAAARRAASILGDATELAEPDEGALRKATRVGLALRALVAEESLSAVAVRCFDLLDDRDTTGCVGLAELNDEGIVAACEGDIPSALGMLIGQHLLGATPWMANPVRLDDATDRLWLAHCTAPPGALRSFGLRSHFESGRGVAIAGDFGTGPVTLFRVGGSDLRALWVADGELLRGGGRDESQCRTQVEIRLESGRVAELLRRPLGNHLVMVRGHGGARLRTFWENL